MQGCYFTPALRFCHHCSIACPLAVPVLGWPEKITKGETLFFRSKVIFMPNCLYLPAWLPKKTETCTKCHETGFVRKEAGVPVALALELTCLHLQLPAVISLGIITSRPCTGRDAHQTHFTSCLLHPWLRKVALVTGSVFPSSDNSVRSQGKAQVLGLGSCC